jgi:hypothetical protein
MTVVRPETKPGIDQWWHPEAGALGIYYEPARPEQHTRGGQLVRAARPAHVRLTGPLGGSAPCDLADLDREIRRLTDARDTLAALLEREPLATDDGQGVMSL